MAWQEKQLENNEIEQVEHRNQLNPYLTHSRLLLLPIFVYLFPMILCYHSRPKLPRIYLIIPETMLFKVCLPLLTRRSHLPLRGAFAAVGIGEAQYEDTI